MRNRPLLLDVGCLCDAHVDQALEGIYKAIGEDPPDDDIWSPHPNPYVRRILDLITERGLRRHADLEAALQRWLRGEEHADAFARPTRPEGLMARWSAGELGLVQEYLRALPPAAWTLDDWMLLVDFLVQRYLPLDDMRSEADWLATRSNFMGRVEAAAANLSEPEITSTLMAFDPAVLGGPWAKMTREQKAAIEFGRARAAEHVRAFSEAARDKLRATIMNWQEAVYLGNRADAVESLQSVLLDQFGTMNRDWRRIAVTEVTENQNQGFVAAQPPGTKVRRVEKYRGACAFCRSIDGKIFTVVDPATPTKDGETEIWVGKTNVGRSASPRKRENGQLVEREPHERWWVAAGVQHPHCRGSWVVVGGASEDPEFEAWLADLKRKKKGATDVV